MLEREFFYLNEKVGLLVPSHSHVTKIFLNIFKSCSGSVIKLLGLTYGTRDNPYGTSCYTQTDRLTTSCSLINKARVTKIEFKETVIAMPSTGHRGSAHTVVSPVCVVSRMPGNRVHDP